jgi:tetratricopeptide (TPR) repeat protein
MDYQQTCSEMLARLPANFESADLSDVNKMAWACALAPNKVLEDQENQEKVISIVNRLLDMARANDEDVLSPRLHRCLNTCGAVHLRMGNYGEAIRLLEQSETEFEKWQAREMPGRPTGEVKGKIWNWLFLAIAYAATGEDEKAVKWFSDAEKELDRGQFARGTRMTPDRYAEVLGVSSPTWDQRLSLELLYEEAKQAIEKLAERPDNTPPTGQDNTAEAPQS